MTRVDDDDHDDDRAHHGEYRAHDRDDVCRVMEAPSERTRVCAGMRSCTYVIPLSRVLSPSPGMVVVCSGGDGCGMSPR